MSLDLGRRSRIGSNLLMAIAVLCVGLAIAARDGRPLRGAEGLAIPPSGVIATFQGGLPNEPIPVRIALNNPGSRPVRILGVREICTSVGCIRGFKNPAAVPGGQSAEILVEVWARSPGVFELESAVYTDSTEAPAVPLKIRGFIGEPPAS